LIGSAVDAILVQQGDGLQAKALERCVDHLSEDVPA
jgi:hypothetical protein